MSITTDRTELDIARVTRLSRELGEPSWVADGRAEAFEVFTHTAWPTRTDEAWRRTDISMIRFEEMLAETPLVDKKRGENSTSLLTEDANAGATLIETDGMTTELRISDALKRQGVVVCDLHTAVRDHADILRDYINRAPYLESDRKFVALARALWTGGKFVYVPKNVEAVLPVELHTVIADARAVFPRLLVIAEAGSKVAILEEFVSHNFDRQTLSSGAADIYLGDGADVRYVLLNRWGDNVFHFHHQRTQLGRDSHLKTLTIGLGSRLTKATIEAVLDHPGAVSDMLGLVFGTGKQHFDHHTSQDHRVGNTLSDLLFKTALDDHAHSVYSGLIRIEKQAQNANAYQANNNLLLSRDAAADTIPNLEIEANEVRCTHGATVAPVEPEYVFYLMSRGIPEDEAKRLIVEGWFEQVLDRADIESLHELISAQIAVKINAAHSK